LFAIDSIISVVWHILKITLHDQHVYFMANKSKLAYLFQKRNLISDHFITLSLTACCILILNFLQQNFGWLRGTVVERRSVTGELSLSFYLQLMGDH